MTDTFKTNKGNVSLQRVRRWGVVDGLHLHEIMFPTKEEAASWAADYAGNFSEAVELDVKIIRNKQ